MSKIHKNDIGTLIRVNTGINLTGVIVSKLLIEKPNGVKVQWTSVIEDIPQGILRYITVLGDLNIPGRYTLNAYVEFSGGARFTGETTFFEVFE